MFTNSSYSSDSEPAGSQIGGPTDSSSWSDMGSPFKGSRSRSPYASRSRSHSPPTTPRSGSPSVHRMQTRSRSAEPKRRRRIQSLPFDFETLMMKMGDTMSKSIAKGLSKQQTEKFQSQFQFIRDEGLTQMKLNTHLLNLDAHFMREGILNDTYRKKFLGSRLDGYTLSCFNKLMPLCVTYEELVKRLREERFGPRDRWSEMIAIEFSGAGSPVDYWRDKLEGLKQYDSKYTPELAIEQILAGMQSWSHAEEIRKESFRVRGSPAEKLEAVKSFFFQIATMPKNNKDTEVNAIQEDKSQLKCWTCHKLGHMGRNCPDRGGARRV